MAEVTAAQSRKPRLEAPPVVITGIRPGLDIRGLDRGETPVADWLCACGHHERARGGAAVQNLCERVIVGVCPHLTAPSGGGQR